MLTGMEEPIRIVVDPLGDALHALRMDGAFYCRSECSAPWGLALPPLPGYLWFHVVTSGTAWLATPGAEPRALRPGELTLVPHGTGHDLVSAPGAAAPPILSLARELVSERYEVLRTGGGGEATHMICGAVRFSHPAAAGLVALLPDAIQVDAAGTTSLDRMHATLGLIGAEAREPQPGGEAVITRLADILVIQAIRHWIHTAPTAQTGWLGALQDPQIGPAIALLHREHDRTWTIAELAAAVAMSRSAFAARFTAVVGEPVIQYATRWRMHVALDALQHERATVGEVAARLGYRSEAAFARAFKRVLGLPPGAARSRARTDADTALAEAFGVVA